MHLVLRTVGDGRTIRKVIIALLKSHTAICIDRVNYVQSYHMDTESKKCIKTSKKLIFVEFDSAKESELLRMIDKLSTSLCHLERTTQFS